MSYIEGLTNKELFYILQGGRPETIQRAYWAVKIDETGDPKQDWISEARPKVDIARGVTRLTDWTADVVHAGHCAHIRELWLFCPPGRLSPSGNSARIPILAPYTAFQFKVGAFLSNIVASKRHMRAMLAGRVDDRVSGDAVIFIWDEEYGVMWEPWKQNIKEGLGTWRESIAPLGKLALDEIGVKL